MVLGGIIVGGSRISRDRDIDESVEPGTVAWISDDGEGGRAALRALR